MAYISQRGAYWRAEVRKRGHKPIYRTFDTRQQAQQWAERTEAEITIGAYVDRTEAERTTLHDALHRYLREVVPGKRYPEQERTRIARWQKHDLAWRTLASLRGADFAQYRDARRTAGRAENTIRLELQLVSHVFEIARKEWGFDTLTNPLKNIRKPSGSRARDRRLHPGEFEALRDKLAASSNPWAPLAFELAIETSLRQGTLFSLQWKWVKLTTRMIEFPPEARGADNKGVPPRLPLSHRAVDVLRALAALWQRDQLTNIERSQFGPVDVAPSLLSGPVFGTTCNAVVMVWKRAVKSEDPHGLERGVEGSRARHQSIKRFYGRLERMTDDPRLMRMQMRRLQHVPPEPGLLDKLNGTADPMKKARAHALAERQRDEEFNRQAAEHNRRRAELLEQLAGHGLAGQVSQQERAALAREVRVQKARADQIDRSLEIVGRKAQERREEIEKLKNKCTDQQRLVQMLINELVAASPGRARELGLSEPEPEPQRIERGDSPSPSSPYSP